MILLGEVCICLFWWGWWWWECCCCCLEGWKAVGGSTDARLGTISGALSVAKWCCTISTSKSSFMEGPAWYICQVLILLSPMTTHHGCSNIFPMSKYKLCTSQHLISLFIKGHTGMYLAYLVCKAPHKHLTVHGFLGKCLMLMLIHVDDGEVLLVWLKTGDWIASVIQGVYCSMDDCSLKLLPDLVYPQCWQLWCAPQTGCFLLHIPYTCPFSCEAQLGLCPWYPSCPHIWLDKVPCPWC